MENERERFGITVDLNADHQSAIETVTAALQLEGFGVLTEIDVRTTLKKKIDVDFRPYTILGACNPVLAHRALSAVSQIGLMLPCNVTVEQLGPGQTRVTIADPTAMLAVVDDPALAEVAREARERLLRVAETMTR